jgi:hypothetical protein
LTISGCSRSGPDAAEGLYRLVDAAYERRSVAVSSNLHPSGFDELMPKTLATATADRLLHTLTCARPAARVCACPKPSPALASSPSPAPDEPHQAVIMTT